MFLIIQTGDPVASAKQKYGTFDQWFIQGMGISPQIAQVVNVHRQQALPDAKIAAEDLTGIIITGSPAMVTDKDDWLLQTQKWLEVVLPQNIPTLGVCFGHQLLANLLGGEVDYNPKGRNLGSSKFILNQAAKEDALFSHLSEHSSITTFVSHLQHVKQLPASTTRLGFCEMDENHAFRYQQHIWGLQFHPEWNAAITRTYIETRNDDLLNEGLNPVKIIQKLKASPQAYDLLQRFKTLTTSYQT